MTARNKLKKLKWEKVKDDNGDQHYELWDTFLQKFDCQGTIIPEYNKNMKKIGFRAQLWDQDPSLRKTLKGAKSWLETCYRVEVFKIYNI